MLFFEMNSYLERISQELDVVQILHTVFTIAYISTVMRRSLGVFTGRALPVELFLAMVQRLVSRVVVSLSGEGLISLVRRLSLN